MSISLGKKGDDKMPNTFTFHHIKFLLKQIYPWHINTSPMQVHPCMIYPANSEKGIRRCRLRHPRRAVNEVCKMPFLLTVFNMQYVPSHDRSLHVRNFIAIKVCLCLTNINRFPWLKSIVVPLSLGKMYQYNNNFMCMW